jgi:hypothetical protein
VLECQRIVRAFILGTVVVLFSTVHAAQAPKTVEDLVKEQYALLIDKCNPSAEQKQALQEKFKLKQTILESWDQANGARLQAAKDAAAAAKKGTDEEAKRKADAEQRGLQDDRVHATYETECAVYALLDPEQKITWAGAQLAEYLMPKYGRAKPADEQWTRVKEACRAAGKEISAKVGDEKKERDARNNVERCVRWAIENIILTPEQVNLNNGIKPPPIKPPAPPSEFGAPTPAAAPAPAKPVVPTAAVPIPVVPPPPVVKLPALPPAPVKPPAPPPDFK